MPAPNESIYDLIPQPVAPVVKQPMYHSKHPGNAPPTFSTFGLAGTSKPGYNNVGGAGPAPEQEGFGKHSYTKVHATFGNEGNRINPNDILNKGTGKGGGATMLAADPAGTFQYGATVKVAVPTRQQCIASETARPTKETKNFITHNAVENILSVPKREAQPVDWTKKPNYGKVPPYVSKIKKEIADEYNYIRTMQQAEQDSGPAGMRQLGEDERQTLTNSLKGKWDEVNANYQRSSCLSLASLDTIGKVKRKEMYEAQLAQIERDIEKLSKPVVYVADDEQY